MYSSKIKEILLKYPSLLFSINFSIIMIISHLSNLYLKLEMLYCFILVCALSYLMYHIEISLLSPKVKLRTIEEIIEDAWKENKKKENTTISKKKFTKITIPRWVFDKLSNTVKDRISIEKIEEHCVTILCFDDVIMKYLIEFTNKLQQEKEDRELEGLRTYLFNKNEEDSKGKRT